MRQAPQHGCPSPSQESTPRHTQTQGDAYLWRGELIVELRKLIRRVIRELEKQAHRVGVELPRRLQVNREPRVTDDG